MPCKAAGTVFSAHPYLGAKSGSGGGRSGSRGVTRDVQQRVGNTKQWAATCTSEATECKGTASVHAGRTDATFLYKQKGMKTHDKVGSAAALKILASENK